MVEALDEAVLDAAMQRLVAALKNGFWLNTAKTPQTLAIYSKFHQLS